MYISFITIASIENNDANRERNIFLIYEKVLNLTHRNENANKKTLKYHFTYFTLAKMKKFDNTWIGGTINLSNYY